MRNMAVSRLARWFAVALGCALAFTVPRAAVAQDRAVGREALDPADQETLPPSIDGRTDAPEEIDPRAIDEFREPLEPYGAWVQDARYGTVWVPDASVVGPDFYPYSTDGHWELTPEGDWLWVSDHAWGEIPFHYGRWVWIEGRGWSWIPGRVWAPAWVVWRTGPSGYIGWAPCPPTWTWWYGHGGWYGSWLWWPPPAAYVFVETRHVFHHHVHDHVIRTPARARHAAQQTAPQRHPARPGAPSFDRNRPASPDLRAIRYEGPRPPVRRVDRPTDAALGGARTVGPRGTRTIGPRGTRAEPVRDGFGRVRPGPADRTRGTRTMRPERWSPPDRRLPSAGAYDGRPTRGPTTRPAMRPSRGPTTGPRPMQPPGGARRDVSRPPPSAGRPAPAPRRVAPSGPPPMREAPHSSPPPRINSPRPSAPPSGGMQRAPVRAPTVAPAPVKPAPRPGPAAPRGRGRGRIR